VPELPEVEYAARVARAAAVGKVIARVRVLHRSQRRALPDRAARSLAGDVVQGVDRRGKHQLLRLASGRTLHVHFRMTGDWHVLAVDDLLPKTVRVALDFEDGTRLALDDSRALSVVALCHAGVDPCADLGPEANADRFNADWLAERLAGRRSPIKVALLDQRLVAGIGNIYASEALWYARIDPRHPAQRLAHPESAVTRGVLRALTSGVKRAMQKALDHPERYYSPGAVSDAVRFNVYDREGKGCRRCRTPIARITQAARSTYFCPTCQSSPSQR
jgi:formamidopyrimidine-DNA glycosylase